MAVEVYLPKMSDHMQAGKIIRWLVKEGELVKRGQVLFEIETDKAVGEVEAPADGTLQGVRIPEGGEAPVGQAVAFITRPGETPLAYSSTAPASPLPPTVPQSGPDSITRSPTPPIAPSSIIPATPIARRVAKDLGIDLRLLKGSGPNGRVREGDVRAYHASLTPALSPEERQERTAQAAYIPPAGQPSDLQPENVQLSTLQKITAERMLEAIRNIPHFFLQVDVDMTRALGLLDQVRERILAEVGVRASVTALLVRVAAQAIKQHPRVNASFEDSALKVHSQINIGVAAGTEGGLVVPVIHQADQKSLAQIAAEVKRYQAQLAGLRFTPQELSGGTFTLSNLGMYGVDRFSAIINPPQSAILAAGRIAKTPAALADDTVAVRPIMTLTLSVDHRALDGVQGAQFLAEVKALLEQPYYLI
jgi:pyruvate dehydrogenase E2 component (dihydrolipoamide acetyltransferase)